MADFGLHPEEKSKVKPMPKLEVNLIEGIKPRTYARPTRDIAESDKMAATVGFTSREPNVTVEPYIRPARAKRNREQTYPLSMRAPVSVLQKFIAYAEKYSVSYPYALEKLLQESEELARLQGGKL